MGGSEVSHGHVQALVSVFVWQEGATWSPASRNPPSTGYVWGEGKHDTIAGL